MIGVQLARIQTDHSFVKEKMFFVSTYQKTEESVTLGINAVAWEQSCYFYWFVIAVVWFAPVLLYAG